MLKVFRERLRWGLNEDGFGVTTIKEGKRRHAGGRIGCSVHAVLDIWNKVFPVFLIKTFSNSTAQCMLNRLICSFCLAVG